MRNYYYKIVDIDDDTTVFKCDEFLFSVIDAIDKYAIYNEDAYYAKQPDVSFDNGKTWHYYENLKLVIDYYISSYPYCRY